MQKKQNRRFTHKGQIEVEIENTKKKAKDLMRSAAALDTIAGEYFKLSNLNSSPFYRELGVGELQKARKLRTTATNLLDKKVKDYSDKMAELQTMPLPGFMSDNSVEA